MHIAVCIVSFRNAHDVAKCLTALASSTHRDFEVLICENGGLAAYGALTEDMPATLPGGQSVSMVMAESNLGYAGGLNVCFRMSPGADAWWVLNPDTEPDVDALQALVGRLEAGDCGLVGATVYSPDGRVESRAGRWRPWLARTASIGFGERLDGAVDAARIEREASYVSGSCMLVGRPFMEAVGPMNEQFFLYCEEVDWCLTGLKRGQRLGYAPQARVLHRKGTATGSVADVRERPLLPVYLDERNKMLLCRIHNPIQFPIAVLAAVGLLLIRFGKRRAWRQLGYALQGWLAGLANQRGAPSWVNT